ncbi:Bgt-20528 [Blumeria graminis f. sp. tritici]|uniref:Bgt-20528 n=2 Tax=Blumeria graminis f. sp. tritici TaxID=62690 RepID=A0A9X9LA04_BLUGR|nr:Bgt-20528 [Blumeria graminis f. sp. tritici]
MTVSSFQLHFQATYKPSNCRGPLKQWSPISYSPRFVYTSLISSLWVYRASLFGSSRYPVIC